MNLLNTLKNIAYSFGANLTSLCISIFMVMFVPKFLSVNDYGLWQLFLFYFSYLGFLHFGWEGGIDQQHRANSCVRSGQADGSHMCSLAGSLCKFQ